MGDPSDRINLYVPRALLHKARTVLPPEESISRILRDALEVRIAEAERAQATGTGVDA